MRVLLAREIERLRNFACRCQERNDFLMSYWSLKRVLDISDKESLGCESYADILVELGLVCMALSKITEGKSLFTRALSLYREIYPEEGFPVQDCLKRIEQADTIVVFQSPASLRR